MALLRLPEPEFDASFLPFSESAPEESSDFAPEEDVEEAVDDLDEILDEFEEEGA